MKKITKKQAAAFCKDAAALIVRLGFATPPHKPENYRRAMTDYGPFTCYQPNPDLEWGHCCVDINGVYAEAPPRDVADRLGVSLPSRKWNVLHSDPDTVLREFERRMRQVNVRACTPEEAAALDALDAAERARLDLIVAEWRKEQAASDPRNYQAETYATTP